MRLGAACAAGVEEREEMINPSDLGEIPDKPMLCTQGLASKESVPSIILADNGGDDTATGSSKMSSTPRSQGSSACDGPLADTEQVPEGVHSGDAYDPRWLSFAGEYKMHEESQSGDGTMVNVGLNLSGSLQCSLCVQQFTDRNALNVHTKFFHGEEQHDWLCYPSA